MCIYKGPLTGAEEQGRSEEASPGQPPPTGRGTGTVGLSLTVRAALAQGQQENRSRDFLDALC